MSDETRLDADDARLLITTEETAVGADADPVGIHPGLARGSLSASHIVFMVMAAVAPAAVAVSLLPLALGLGVGVGTPGMFVVVALVLTVFAVGFTRMVPHVRNAGAFFAYIAKGLGDVTGLAAAYVAVVSYLAIMCATAGSFGFFGSLTLEQFFGFHVPWWVCTLAGLTLCLVLGYLRITMAAGVLAVAFVAEAIAVLVLDFAILFQNGLGSFTLDSFNPTYVFPLTTVGVGVIYAFSGFQGFEGTAIYAEEARDPDRTVPRATYAAILGVCVFYVFTSLAMISGGGGAAAPAKALADPGNFAYHLSDEFVSTAWTSLLQILIVTSSFAGTLAFHNAASRYLYALGRDGFMPRACARTHPRYSSPTVAGAVSFLFVVIVVGLSAAFGLDPLTVLATSFTGVGAVGLMGLLTATSLAVAVFFWRRGLRDLRHTVAPLLAALLLCCATVMALVDYEYITGTGSAVINRMPWIHLVVVVMGVAVALRAKKCRPDIRDGVTPKR